MPYFNKANILLIHIPKTGGTSIEIYFSQKYNIPLNSHSIYYRYYENQIAREVEQKQFRWIQAWEQAILHETHRLKMLRGPAMQPIQHTMNTSAHLSLSVSNLPSEPPKYSKNIPAHAIAKHHSNTHAKQLPKPPPKHLAPSLAPAPSLSLQELSPKQKEQIKQSLPEYLDFAKVKVSRDVKHSLHHLTWVELKKYQDVFWKSADNKQDLFGEQLIEYRAIRVFTVVRNPYDRILSELFFLDCIKPSFTPNQVHVRLRQFLLNPSTFDNHKLPQHLFVTEEDGSLIRGLIVLRTETLTKDMRAHGFSDFNVKQNTLHHVIALPDMSEDTEQIQPPCKYIKYLNAASIQMINRYYREDFELFGYPMMEEEPTVETMDVQEE